MTFPADWLHYHEIAIDHTQVPALLSEYVGSVRGSDLPASFWDNVASDGSDIQFTLADGVTLLNHDLVEWDYAGNEAVIRYRAPTVSGVVDTVVRLYSGSSQFNWLPYSRDLDQWSGALDWARDIIGVDGSVNGGGTLTKDVGDATFESRNLFFEINPTDSPVARLFLQKTVGATNFPGFQAELWEDSPLAQIVRSDFVVNTNTGTINYRPGLEGAGEIAINDFNADYWEALVRLDGAGTDGDRFNIFIYPTISNDGINFNSDVPGSAGVGNVEVYSDKQISDIAGQPVLYTAGAAAGAAVGPGSTDATYPADWLAYYDLGQTPAGADSVIDRTANNRHGTPAGGVTLQGGQVGDALSFATNGTVDVGAVGNVYGLSFWVDVPFEITSASASQGLFKHGPDNAQHVIVLGSYTGLLDGETLTIANLGSGFSRTAIKTNIPAGRNKIDIGWNGSHYDIALNGVYQTVYPATAGDGHCPLLNFSDFDIGGGTTNFKNYIIALDEVRLHDVTPLGAEVAASYANEFNPASFYSVGPAIPVSGQDVFDIDVAFDVVVNASLAHDVIFNDDIVIDISAGLVDGYSPIFSGDFSANAVAGVEVAYSGVGQDVFDIDVSFNIPVGLQSTASALFIANVEAAVKADAQTTHSVVFASDAALDVTLGLENSGLSLFEIAATIETRLSLQATSGFPGTIPDNAFIYCITSIHKPVQEIQSVSGGCRK